jgi:hypothetical protein
MAILALILYVLANTIPRWIEGINGDVFCKWQALSYLFLVISGNINKRSKYEKIAFTWAILLTVNNAFDELFGNPYKVSIFEISFAILVTVWTVIRCRKGNII